MRFTQAAGFAIVSLVGYAHAASYSVTYYSDNNCQNKIGSARSTFSANGCSTISGTNSMIINFVDGARIHVWNHAGCNGNETGLKTSTCPVGNSACIKTPGTNSFGFQLGCTS
ncbi:hypothetical protein FB451DRAFT_1396891 [Mycena latifolia]|nr:hypothetical protein FB451DRAFT_1396891 [Mycena latifolia]